MKKLLLVSFLVLLGLSLLGCPKPARKSSPEYQKARGIWFELLGQKKLTEAYLSPEAEEVLALLDRVDQASLDYKMAGDLKAEIQKGRSEAKAGEVATQALLAKATHPNPEGSGTARPPQRPDLVPPPVTADAGVAIASEPKPGMSEQEFLSRFGRCFEVMREATVSGVPGKVWSLQQDLSKCRSDFPSFASRSVVVVNGKVDAIRPTEELVPKQYRLIEGKLVPVDPNAPPPPPPPPSPVPAKAAVPAPTPTTTLPMGRENSTLPVTSQP